MTQKLLKMQSIKKTISGPSDDGDVYSTALRLYWGGLYQECGSFLGDQLSRQNGHPSNLRLYRLWIETMAIRGDEASLKLLTNHFFRMACDADVTSEKTTWHALKGLCHMELDEVDAARLELHCLGDQHNDVYGSELRQKIWDRSLIGGRMPLLDFDHAIADYVVWTSLAKSLMANNDQKGFAGVVSHIDGVFSGSPLKLETDFFQNFKNQNWQDSEKKAEVLHQCYPDRADYSYYFGICQLYNGKAKLASSTLSKTLRLEPDHPDTLTALGRCLQVQADFDPDFIEEAMSVYAKALRMRRSLNLPTADISFQSEKLREMAKNLSNGAFNSDDLEATQSWFVLSQPNEFHWIQAQTENDIDCITRSIGEDARPGDLVFFAGENKFHSQPGWRIYAIYVVAGPAAYHPIHGYESVLQLIVRPQLSIPLDLVVLDEGEDKLVDDRMAGGSSADVYRLELGDLDIINEAIKQRNLESSDLDITNKLTKYGWTS